MERRIVPQPETSDYDAAPTTGAVFDFEPRALAKVIPIRQGIEPSDAPPEPKPLYKFIPMERYVPPPPPLSESYAPFKGTGRAAHIGNVIMRSLRNEWVDLKAMLATEKDE